MSNKIYVLGIESSCDDTAVAVVSSDKEILSNIVINQNTEHSAYLGVVPEIAARSHMQNLPLAVKTALDQANLKIEQIDAVAATSGPGLIGGVIVGCMMAKAIASVHKKPFIAVNHLEGHILSGRLSGGINYPFLVLLVSGGHSQFVIARALGQYQIIGQTLDDAAGEAYDKVAKMLKIGFPGGPLVEFIAKSGDPYRFILPKPLFHSPNCNLSFSGLKTAVKLEIQKVGELSKQDTSDMAASFQYIVGEVLVKKLQNAIQTYQLQHSNNQLVLVGGVAANQYLRQKLTEVANQNNFSITIPETKICTDNGAMIAWAGVERYMQNKFNSLDFCPRSRWSLEDLQ